MKPIIPRLSHYTTLFFFPFLLVARWRGKLYILLVLGMLVLAGCFKKFYSTGTTTSADSTTIEKLKNANKYFIIHYKDSLLALSNVAINNNVIEGKGGSLLKEHTTQLYPESNEALPLKNKNEASLLSEVHLYVNYKKSASTEYPAVKIPLSDIYRMDVYAFNKKKTNSSTVLSIVGIAAGVALVVVVLAVGTSGVGDIGSPTPSTTNGQCGCPQVYVEQKGNFDFKNGIFSGAVYANLERIDYLPLGDLQPENSDIRLRISGHDNEIQFLNSAQLIGVYHKQGSRIMVDGYGKFYSISNPELPEAVMGPGNQDLKETLSKADGNTFAFNTYDPKEEFSKAYLTFRKPLENGKARLLIRAKNSNWAATINEEYTLLFGEKYSRYRDYWENTSPEKMKAFLLNQGLPIKVYVENEGKWNYAGYFPLSGTEGYRDMVMEIKLTENKSTHFRIKLETVYRFWDLDYAAIDYSLADSLETFMIGPTSAYNIQRGDQKEQVHKIDENYAELDNNESLSLEFRVPENAENNAISYFLASSGYYHIQKTYLVKANVSRLREFKKPGEFDRFSRDKYQEMEQWQSLAVHMNQASNREGLLKTNKAN